MAMSAVSPPHETVAVPSSVSTSTSFSSSSSSSSSCSLSPSSSSNLRTTSLPRSATTATSALHSVDADPLSEPSLGVDDLNTSSSAIGQDSPLSKINLPKPTVTMLRVQHQTSDRELDQSLGKKGLSSTIMTTRTAETEISEGVHPLAGGLTADRAIDVRMTPARSNANPQGPKGRPLKIENNDHCEKTHQDEAVPRRIPTEESRQDSSPVLQNHEHRSIEFYSGGNPLAPESAVKNRPIDTNNRSGPRSSFSSPLSSFSGSGSDRGTEKQILSSQPTFQSTIPVNGPLPSTSSSALSPKSRDRTLSVTTKNRFDYGLEKSDMETQSAPTETDTPEIPSRKSILDPLLPSRPTTESEEFAPIVSRRRRPSSAGQQPPMVLLRQSPAVEHLSDMGPLELEREIDYGVPWNQNTAAVSVAKPPTSSSLPSSNRTSRTGASIPEELSAHEHEYEHDQTVHHTYSSSTLVSESSKSSSQSGSEILSRVRDGHDGSNWDGDHPLLLDFTMEPELLEEEAIESDSLPNINNNSSGHSQLQDRTTGLRHKGHSMSMDTGHESAMVSRTTTSTTGVSFHISGPPSSPRRRKNASRTQEDQDKDQDQHGPQGHARTMTESVGKRVIIHQIAITDTLAGIALYYGIQVPILKKSNKLWTNDSIHTRKYLYIPFEDCSVARQAGVMVDEGSHSVLLPQRRQTSLQSRTGTGAPAASSFTPSRMSTYDLTLNNNSLPNSHGGNHLSGYRPSLDQSSISSETPEISAVAARMLPIPTTSSSSSIAIPSSSISPRLGTWTDSKSVAAPPLSSSPSITSILRKSDNQHSTLTPLSPTRISTTTTTAGDGFAVSGSLPDTVIVAPSMTHEALAARFKEMDIVSAEQQRKSQQAQEQELRTNPIHHRHRTSDLRQYAHLQQHQQHLHQQRPTRPLEEGFASSSNTSSRRTSVETSGIRDLFMKSGQQGSSRRGSTFGQASETEITNPGFAIEERVEEEDPDSFDDGDDQSSSKASDGASPFVTFGHHQHIYQTYDPGSTSGSSRHGLEGSNSSSASSVASSEQQPRRQELITVPEGMLSYFPSPEHSKRLETPQSISKLQHRVDSYQSSPSSTISSAPSSSPSSRRGGPYSRTGGNGTRPKSRILIGDQTFEAPNQSDASSAALQPSSRPSPSTRRTNSTSGSTTSSTSQKPASLLSAPPNKSTYSKSVRVSSASTSSAYSPQKWSLMGESLVDDLLGAVRGPLQIARRMYNLSSFGFGGAASNLTTTSNSGKEGFQDSYSGLSRRVSNGGGSKRSRNGRGSQRNSIGYAIELDQAKTPRPPTDVSTAPIVGGSVVKRMPTNESIESGGQRPSGRGSTRRKSSSGSSTGYGHGHRQGSSGSVISNDGSNTVRKRSLRSSNPVNHGALMALVNELDKDKKEKERRLDHQVGESLLGGTARARAVGES